MKMADQSSATSPYSLLGQRVAGEREVGERDQPGGADPHREDRRAPAVAATARARLAVIQSASSPLGRGASSTGTASAPARPSRSAPAATANERLDQWFTWPGVLPSCAQVGAARHVEPAPERLARHRHEQPAARHARHLGQRGLGLGHVLEHLDRGGQVELVVGERQGGGVRGPELEVRAPALAPIRPPAWDRRGRCPPRGPSPRRSAHSTVSTPSPQPTSSSESRARRSSRARRGSRGSRPSAA